MADAVAPVEPRFHQERSGAVIGALPFPASSDHTTFVRETYASALGAPRPERSNNPYALLPDTLAFLSRLLEALSPETIVEFGSGQSTDVFAGWVARHASALVSVEHDRGWVATVEARLPAEARARVRMVHAPLRLARRGLRQFFTYEGLEGLASDVVRAKLLLLDGPHISGRELVLHLVLSSCAPGAVIVVDDYHHYAVREMLVAVPPALASCFVGAPIDENSHGLYVLRCLRVPMPVSIPSGDLRAILRSYWRCLLDYRRHGRGD